MHISHVIYIHIYIYIYVEYMFVYLYNYLHLFMDSEKARERGRKIDRRNLGTCTASPESPANRGGPHRPGGLTSPFDLKEGRRDR